MKKKVVAAQKVVNVVGDMITHMTEMAIHCQDQYEEIVVLKKENAFLRQRIERLDQ